MDMEELSTPMIAAIRETGLKDRSTAMVMNSGLMEAHIQDSTSMGAKPAKEVIYGQMAGLMKETLSMEILKVKVSSYGPLEKFM